MPEFSTKDYHLSSKDRIVKIYLEKALAEFSRSLITTKLIRRFSLETPDLFCNAALSILESPDDSAGQRYLVILLLKQPALLRLLSDPWRFTRKEAIALFTQLMVVDPTLDVRLAHCLPNRYGAVAGVPLHPLGCERALEILDETSRGRRIIPILGHLVDHRDPRISSKATLAIGKRVQSVDWALRQLKEQENPRVRANAIESIWGLDTPESRDLLWDSTRDENNRLAGNSWFGLHILREENVYPNVVTMAASAKADFRCSAAWVMGTIADPRFFDPLVALIKDDHPGVRSTALRSLVGLAQKTAQEAEHRKLQEACEKQQQEIAEREEMERAKAAEAFPAGNDVQFVTMRG